ncbi:transferase [Leptodontidium sp. 2 PMI_412]|nr:transferase [Leptodontidium sp. 2 PMI_412]
MSFTNPESLSAALLEKSCFVTLDEYGIKPQSAVEIKLSPLDLNMPRLYGARWILCFPLPADADKAVVFENLKKGLAHTIASIPWLSGDVGPEIGSDPKDGRLQVLEGKGGVEFIYKDLSSILPSYAELEKYNFTFSKLTTPLVSPLQVIQQTQPVFAAQANFIQGGLLLTIGLHHSVCDGAAQDFILETWALDTAAASGSNSFTKHDPISNDRTPMIDGIPTENISDFPEYVLAPTPPADQTNMAAPVGFQMPPMTSKIFTFSPSTLAALKVEAKAYSTNDAVVGLFWHHMSAARNPSPADDTATSAALFAVNIRGRTSPPLPQSYLGNASFGSLTPRLSITSLTHPSSGLSLASSSLRSALNALNTPSRVPLTIGLLSSRPNPQDFKFAARGFLGPDITATSWADIRVREREWGVLGRPEGFRVPYEAADGNVTVFPRLEGGGLEVMCCLEDGAMERMVGNEEFVKFAMAGLV